MNQQAPEKSVFTADGSLQIHSLFHTIQGEGPFTGHRAVFIRLAGCNLQCPQCDTDYTSNRFAESPQTLLTAVQAKQASGLVVITGGEPFRQNIVPLCKELTDAGYFVQIETNGTLPPPSMLFHELCNLDISQRRGVYVVCSPKSGKINPVLRCTIAAYKYVLTDGDVDWTDGLPVHVLDHSVGGRVARPHDGFQGPVYVQPCDLKDDRNYWNTAVAVRSTMEHGHIIQLQVHKLINVE